MLPMILAFLAILMAGAVVAIPHNPKGCWTELARIVALIGGPLALFALLWPNPSKVLEWAVLVPALILAVTVLTLAATGWQALFVRQRENVEKDIDLSIFDPSDMLNSSGNTPANAHSSSDDAFAGCLLAIVQVVIGLLYWLGLQITLGFTRYLMPGPKSPVRRAVRAVLSLGYAAAAFAGVVWLLRM